MSSVTAVQEKKATVRSSTITAPRIVVRTRIVPASRPAPGTKAKSKTRAKAEARAKDRLLGKALLFVVLTVSSYAASSLSGQVMVEKTRREGIVASSRAQLAQEKEKTLRTQIDDLLRPSSIESWAMENGFVLNDAPAIQPKPVTMSLVALRDK